ncbi:hypothetical protein [Yinghuangia seranimata]|uniref:hypothetical protein n=1 Tax=Yinghuangia seranimata TaxID=408067 RepID=UPI00248AB520|nr:hypothetical protein [Yinghuangia seranimata]MDI2127807.1 hypothetical protein [Yinghuangia seranimata]
MGTPGMDNTAVTPRSFTVAIDTARRLKTALADAGFEGLDIRPTVLAPEVWAVAIGAIPVAMAARLTEWARERA